MPLFIPIIIGAISFLSGGVGVAAGAEAVELFNNAQDMSNRAKRRLEEALEKAKAKEKIIRDKFNAFRVLLVDIENTTFAQLKSLIKDASSNHDLNKEITNIARQLQSNSYSNSSLCAGTVFGDAISSIAKGATLSVATPALLTSIATYIGTASTGTAISALTGVAAENAIMAWLGGGALSAGGWGIAGGAIVSNIATGGVGFLIAGIALNIKAEKALTEAKAYSGQVDLEVTKIDNSIKHAGVFERKIDLIHDATSKINGYMKPLVNKSCPQSTKQEAARIIKAIAMASTIKSIMTINMHDNSLNNIQRILDEKLIESQNLINEIN